MKICLDYLLRNFFFRLVLSCISITLHLVRKANLNLAGSIRISTPSLPLRGIGLGLLQWRQEKAIRQRQRP
jgi:hypothetical protein